MTLRSISSDLFYQFSKETDKKTSKRWSLNLSGECIRKSLTRCVPAAGLIFDRRHKEWHYQNKEKLESSVDESKPYPRLDHTRLSTKVQSLNKVRWISHAIHNIIKVGLCFMRVPKYTLRANSIPLTLSYVFFTEGTTILEN